MRWSAEDLADYERGKEARVDTSAPPFRLPANEAGAFARGRLPEQKMNKTEAAYAQRLELQKRAGELLWWRYEAIKLRLADGAWFKIDFFVMTRDFVLEAHETKGFWREAARVRIKVAAEIFPFKFVAIKRAKGGAWEREEFA